MKAELKKREEINITDWDVLADESPQGSIFVKSWYLDAATPGWAGIIVYDNEKPQAIFPLWIKQKYLLKYALQPTFTKYWGVCFANRSFNNTYDEISWKKKITEAVVAALPSDLSAIELNFHPTFDYPLPFFHQQFELLQRYSYSLDLSSSQEEIEKGFAKSVRKKVNKATGNEISIQEDNSLQHLLELFKIYEKQGRLILKQEYFSLFEKIYQSCVNHNCCFIITARNSANEVIASAIFLHDNRCVYFLSGLVDPAHKQTAAMPLIVTHAIAEGKKRGCKEFDFLGSMTESIETFFRGFGSRPVPFLLIKRKKFPLTLLKK